MEDITNEEITPNEDGIVKLNYKDWDWKQLQDTWLHAGAIKGLNISHNYGMTFIPNNIHFLKFLQELDCSSNQLSNLPEEIGLLRRLRVFKAGKNAIVSLPQNIFDNLTLLHTVDLRDNCLQHIPRGIAKCPLTELYLQNNRLLSLPLELALKRNSIIAIDVSGNDSLTSTVPPFIPQQFTSNKTVVLWVIYQHYQTICEKSLVQRKVTEIQVTITKYRNKVEGVKRLVAVKQDSISKIVTKHQQLVEERRWFWFVRKNNQRIYPLTACDGVNTSNNETSPEMSI